MASVSLDYNAWSETTEAHVELETNPKGGNSMYPQPFDPGYVLALVFGSGEFDSEVAADVDYAQENVAACVWTCLRWLRRYGVSAKDVERLVNHVIPDRAPTEHARAVAGVLTEITQISNPLDLTANIARQAQ